MPDLYLDAISSGLQPGFNLNVKGGETVTLGGPSGTGKSRLLRAIIDLDVDTSGDALLDQQQRSQTAATEWRKQVGYLPANSQWWEDTVSTHFSAFPQPLFEALGVDPALFDAQISTLSSGQKQRLSIIRLLCNAPRALLLDEPTANLDEHHTALVEGLLASYQEEHAVPIIWVTHDPNQARRVGHRHYTMTADAITEAPA